MERRWLDFWRRVGAQGDSFRIYADLIARYTESHRFYHTFAHVAHCLDELETVRHLAIDSEALEMALWFHDAIYDTKARDNEEKSAELALNTAKRASLADDFAQQVAVLILATKHNGCSRDPDAHILIDIDLSILGRPRDMFDQYERQIRLEYEWATDKAFVSGRSAVLQSFLDRPAIYSTDFFRTKFEVQARHNITRSLACLSRRT